MASSSVKSELNANIIAKLQELGAYFDNDLPDFIMMLIEKQKPINEIREELNLFLDASTDEFVDWLQNCLESKTTDQVTSSSTLKDAEEPKSLETRTGVQITSELEEEQLDFEENVEEEDDFDEEESMGTKLAKQAYQQEVYREVLGIDTSDTEMEHGLIEPKVEEDETVTRTKRSHSELEANETASNEHRSKVIKLNSSNRQLNDIGLMRRQALDQSSNHQNGEQVSTTNAGSKNQATNSNRHSFADQSKLPPSLRGRIGFQPQSQNSHHHHHQNNNNNGNGDDQMVDLREKLNQKRLIKREQQQKENEQNGQQVDQKQSEQQENEGDGADKKEKCRFWPLCKNGDTCVFYHPSAQCSAFPNCQQGDKCLYIHPFCKFDAICAKKDCPYLHINKKTNQPAGPATCKFFPNCFNPSCIYLHPKVCMYGSNCKNPQCYFSHAEPLTNVAKPHQLKWSSKKENAEPSENNEPNQMAESSKPAENMVLIIKDE